MALLECTEELRKEVHVDEASTGLINCARALLARGRAHAQTPHTSFGTARIVVSSPVDCFQGPSCNMSLKGRWTQLAKQQNALAQLSSYAPPTWTATPHDMRPRGLIRSQLS
jgi:hypothetical protein